MVNVSLNKKNQRKELEKMNIKLELSKQLFSQEFSTILHDFSKAHHEEKIKEFRKSWNAFITNEEIQEKIKQEMVYMREKNYSGTDEEIMKKIYISARFYYRKKMKKQQEDEDNSQDQEQEQPNQEQKQKKPYIGFTKEFIGLMDKNITEIMKESREQNNAIKISQKECFQKFTIGHIKEIKEELYILTERYDELDEAYDSQEIANKLKKAYQNRFYCICKLLKNSH